MSCRQRTRSCPQSVVAIRPMPGSVAHALETTLAKRLMAVRGASAPGVIASHDDPERGGGKDEHALEPLPIDDHGYEQHDTEHDRDDGIGTIERPEPSHQGRSYPDGRADSARSRCQTDT